MADDPKPRGVPKQRLDALTDGVFAFSMTLLAISLDLPTGVKVASAGELLALLNELRDNLLVYVISYSVLGARWIRIAKDRHTETWCSFAYAWAVVTHLFFVTLIPFSTKLVGLYGNLWPSVWVYAANTILAAAFSRRAAGLLDRQDRGPAQRADRFDFAALIFTALLSCVIALIAPGYSMYAYLLNVAPLILRIRRGHPD